MKRQFSSILLRSGASLFTCCLLANSLTGFAQEFQTVTSGTPPGSRPTLIIHTGGTGGEFGLVINGSDIGTILLETCDLDQDGKVKAEELKKVAAASFKLWDTNSDGSLSETELSTGLKALFPAPPPGEAGFGVRIAHVIGGASVEFSSSELVKPGAKAARHMELVTPDAQVTKNILAGADSDKNGALTSDEVS